MTRSPTPCHLFACALSLGVTFMDSIFCTITQQCGCGNLGVRAAAAVAAADADGGGVGAAASPKASASPKARRAPEAGVGPDPQRTAALWLLVRLAIVLGDRRVGDRSSEELVLSEPQSGAPPVPLSL